MTGWRNATDPPGTRPDLADAGSEDQFCMRCGGRLDDRTKQCPHCNSPPTIPEETDRVFPVQGPFHAPPPPPPPADRQVHGPVSPSPPQSPPPGIPVKKIAIGIVIMFVVLFLAFIAMGLFNGSTNTNIVPTPLPPTTTVTPGPTPQNPVTSQTDVVPPNTEVAVQVAKSPISNEISVTFAGGPGQRVLKEFIIQVTRSDGQVLTANLIPQQQSEATISGSTGDDRVEVFAIYYSGQKYRIFNEIMKKRVIV